MKNALILFSLTLFYPLFGQKTFQKTFGSSKDDLARWVSLANDGQSFMICGETQSGNSYDGFVMQLTAEGQVAWSKTLGGNGDDELRHVSPANGGVGYVVGGYTTSSGAGGEDMFFAKLDENGNVVWSKTWGGSSDERVNNITAVAGGYLVTGYTLGFIYGNSAAVILKIKEDGSFEWNNMEGGTGTDLASGVMKESNGNLLVTGAGFNGGSIMRFSPSGNLLMAKNYSGNDTEALYYSELLPDGSFILGDHSHSFSASGYQSWVCKSNAAGKLQWSKIYNSPVSNFRGPIDVCADGGVIISPTDYSNPIDGFLIRTDKNGDLIWARRYGGNQSDRLIRAIETPDGGFLAVGGTRSFGNGDEDIYVVKTDAAGLIENCCVKDLPIDVQTVSPFEGDFSPQPFSNSTISNYNQQTTDFFLNETVSCLEPIIADFTISDTLFCKNDCISVINNSIQAGVSYDWKFAGGSPSASAKAQPSPICWNQTGDFPIVLTAKRGECTATKTAFVHVGMSDLTRDSFRICPGDSVFVQSKWIKTEGTFVQTMTNATGCEVTHETTVAFKMDSLVVDSLGICRGDSVQLYGEWVREAGEFMQFVTLETGCVLVEKTIVFYREIGCAQSCKIYWPNAFSPNDDGKNDFWKPSFDCPLQNFKLEIYDRWGELLWRTTDPKTQGWDGSFRKKKLDPATFVWQAEYDFPEKSGGPTTHHLEKGDVTILK